MFFGSIRSLTIVLCLAAISGPWLGTVEGSTEKLWLERECSSHGELAMMLEEIEKAEVIPHLRVNRSAEELVDILIGNGRFRELGLTNEEGRSLVDAFYEKMGIDRKGRVEPGTA